VISVVALPRDSNHYGFVYGGTVMGLVDQAAYAAAIRHTRMTVVTACVEQITFLKRIQVGDVITVRASVNHVGRTSIEVGVRIETERMRTGEIEHVGSAYVTMVALDADGTPVPVPPLLLETDEDRRRYGAARERRRAREARLGRASCCDDTP
jgi:acyl-CoA hydrolase